MNAHRWTDANLAMTLSLPALRIRGILAGKVFPKYDEMKRICGLLEIDICEVEITETVF